MVLALFATPAMGLAVRDDINPGTELDVYEIYNTVYGTTYGSTSGVGGTNPVNSLEAAGLRLGLDEVFALLADGDVSFVARYAGKDQRFGYYTNPFGVVSGDSTTTGVDGDFHWLFDVTAPSNQVLSGPGFTPHFASIPSADSPIGFYDNSPAGSATTWFSQAGRNSDGTDHMAAFYATDGQGLIDPNCFIIAFEDRDAYSGEYDQDFNDLVVEVCIEGFRPYDPIPEPATVSLLLLGLTAAVVRRRFGA
jgi:hypothetical protein